MGRDRGMERWGDGEKKVRVAAVSFSLVTLFFLISSSPYLTIPPSPFLPISRAHVAAHKFHVSFMQIEYNATEKTAEITLRVFADDLENALSQRTGKSVKLDHQDAPSLIAAYLRETLEMKGRNGRVKKLVWIGMEPKADVALLYIEVKIPEGLSGVQLRHRVFFELFEDQVNQVLLKSANDKSSLEFKRGDNFKVLAMTKN